MRLTRTGLAAAAVASVGWLLLAPAQRMEAQATPAACAIDRDVIAGLANPDPESESRLAASFAPGATAHGSAIEPDRSAGAWLAGRVAGREEIGNAATTVNALLVDGDNAIAVWTVTGNAPPEDGDPSGQPAPRRWEGIDVYRFDCGRIAEVWTLDQRIDDPAAMPLAIPPDRSCADPSPTRAEAEAALHVWLVDGWSRGDLEAVNALLDPDVAYHSVPYSETNGPAGVDATLSGSRAAFPDLRNTPAAPVIDGAWAGARWRAEGVNTGGDDPTGTWATWTGVDVVRLQCGRIVEIWSVEDTAAVQAQLAP